MSNKVFISCLAVTLMCHALLTEEHKEKNRDSDIKINDWFVAFDEAAFSENTGLKLHNVLAGADAYEKEFTLWSPRFSVGYHITPNWALEAQLQLGPRERINFFRDREQLYPSTSVESRFMSISTNRSISLGRGYKFEAKIGVVNAQFKNRIKYSESQLNSSFSETKPMVSIGIRKRVTPRLSTGMDFTRYFLSKSGPVTAGTMGLRYSFW